ncbi:hypothetical protein LCGC14_1192600 [marine sediment metagenome]|uniref:Uncharacterized protein n=1 Tax=marine sediment metagenome TaxID=412755 RepID=A0A0F9PP89_9ZZZZ
MSKCYDCDEPYGSQRFPDLIIPNWVWDQISPTGNSGGLLCPCCIIRRLERKGLENIPHIFASGPLYITGADEPAWTWVGNLMERLRRVEDKLDTIQPERGQNERFQIGR